MSPDEGGFIHTVRLELLQKNTSCIYATLVHIKLSEQEVVLAASSPIPHSYAWPNRGKKPDQMHGYKIFLGLIQHMFGELLPVSGHEGAPGPWAQKPFDQLEAVWLDIHLE